MLDPDKYPEVQGLATYKDEEAKGIADVLGVDWQRVLLCTDAYSMFMYRLVTEGYSLKSLGSRKCTSVIFKNSDRGPIVGRNLDASLGGW